MSPLSSILSTNAAWALALVIVAAVLEVPLADYVNRRFGGNAVFRWTLAHVLLPFYRLLAIAGWVLLAYPALFGARAAPALLELAGPGTDAITNPVNLSFLASVLLPLTPLFRNRAHLVVPFQGLLAVAVVFGWFVGYLGATSASWWPGPISGFAVLAMAVVSHLLAVEIGSALGQWANGAFNRTDFDWLMSNALELLLQTPVMLYYGLTLGQQIAI